MRPDARGTRVTPNKSELYGSRVCQTIEALAIRPSNIKLEVNDARKSANSADHRTHYYEKNESTN